MQSMGNWFRQMGAKLHAGLRHFMMGRYGTDKLNMMLLVAALAVCIVGMFFQMPPVNLLLTVISYALMGLAIFRMLSRNLAKRREENRKFLRKAEPVIHWWRLQSTIRKDKEHRYFKCPSCGQHLRVPRGKGKITVTCRGCGASFQEKS